MFDEAVYPHKKRDSPCAHKWVHILKAWWIEMRGGQYTVSAGTKLDRCMARKLSYEIKPPEFDCTRSDRDGRGTFVVRFWVTGQVNERRCISKK